MAVGQPAQVRDRRYVRRRLLGPLSDAVVNNRGTIDKYIGDSIMAFWNAPVDDADHAARACASALAMHAAIDRLNAERAAEPKTDDPPVDLAIGIGINTCEMWSATWDRSHGSTTPCLATA